MLHPVDPAAPAAQAALLRAHQLVEWARLALPDDGSTCWVSPAQQGFSADLQQLRRQLIHLETALARELWR